MRRLRMLPNKCFWLTSVFIIVICISIFNIEVFSDDKEFEFRMGFVNINKAIDFYKKTKEYEQNIDVKLLINEGRLSGIKIQLKDILEDLSVLDVNSDLYISKYKIYLSLKSQAEFEENSIKLGKKLLYQEARESILKDIYNAVEEVRKRDDLRAVFRFRDISIVDVGDNSLREPTLEGPYTRILKSGSVLSIDPQFDITDDVIVFLNK